MLSFLLMRYRTLAQQKPLFSFEFFFKEGGVKAIGTGYMEGEGARRAGFSLGYLSAPSC